MKVERDTTWQAQNNQWLQLHCEHVHEALRVYEAFLTTEDASDDRPERPVWTSEGPLPALERLAQMFGLTPFAVDVLMLAFAPELDVRTEQLLLQMAAQGPAPLPSLALAVRVFGVSSWADLDPTAPLRAWRLVRTEGPNATRGALHLDERIRAYLIGLDALDERLVGYVRHVPPGVTPPLADANTVDALVRALTLERGLVQLHGPDQGLQRELVVAAAAAAGVELWELDLSHVAHRDQAMLARAWAREARLREGAWLMMDGPDPRVASDVDDLRRWVGVADVPCVLLARERIAGLGPGTALEVRSASAAEQRRRWEQALAPWQAQNADPEWLASTARRLASHFDVEATAMEAACTQARALQPTGDPLDVVWEACRTRARRNLDGLAEVIVPRASWDDLLLPDVPAQMLRDIENQVRMRYTVYEDWGFGARSSKGSGTCVLFAGPSGTGKSHAAEVIASSLRLDLVRVDLSSVVSKWIGETEKNLARVFNIAEQGGCVLLFDEADALFGRRSEVKSSHDRHANTEVSFLLQRMETFRGLSILTTNIKDNLDRAFFRRLRFVVDFPFPSAADRVRLWRGAFPVTVPLGALDYDALSRLNLTGGSIRNVATNATFYAASEGIPVTMTHLRRSVLHEYRKLEQPIVETELRDWR